MNATLSRLTLVAALVIPASLTSALAGCSSSDSGVDDASGKAISNVDIGGDLTVAEGATKQMTATVNYADGTTLDATKSADLVWNIGNADVATISAEGLVTGKSIGSTTVKATYQKTESASHSILVK